MLLLHKILHAFLWSSAYNYQESEIKNIRIHFNTILINSISQQLYTLTNNKNLIDIHACYINPNIVN